MSIFRRGKSWYYDFQYKGKRYGPLSIGVTDQESAKQVELRVKAAVVQQYIEGQLANGKVPRPKHPSKTVVYFIYAEEVDRIKIGTTNNIDRRILTLQPGSPVILRVLGTMPGNQALEDQYKRRFSAYRFRGEWFHTNADLIRLIHEQCHIRQHAVKHCICEVWITHLLKNAPASGDAEFISHPKRHTGKGKRVENDILEEPKSIRQLSVTKHYQPIQEALFLDA